MPVIRRIKTPVPVRKRLRILLDPIYITSANLTSSSTYHRYVRITRELVDRGHFVYWIIPDADYQPKEIEGNPQVGIIRSAYLQDMFIIDGIFTDKFFNLFNRMAGTYHIDCLVTNRNSLVAFYKRVLEAPRYHDTTNEFTDKSYGLPIVILEDFAQTRHQHHTSRAYSINQILGYACADRVIFHSDHNRSAQLNEAREILNFREIKRINDNARVIPTGMECQELDQIYHPDRWRLESGFNVICIGRIFGDSYIEFLPWFDYLFKSGHSDVTFTISLSGILSGPMRGKLKKIGFDLRNFGKQFILHQNNPRSNFLRMLRKYHCFVCPVSHYDHPMQLFEALYLGVPGVIPASDYQQTFFKDYPFVIDPKDKEAFLATFLWIKENPEEARRRVAPWRDIIREKYNGPANTNLVCDEIEQVSRGYIGRYRTSAGVVALLRNLKGSSYTFDDIVTYLRNTGRLGVSIGDMSVRQTFTYSRGSINHAVQMAGFEDLCNNPTEQFVRVDKVDAYLAASNKSSD